LPKPIIAILVIGVAIILTLSFVPYSLTRLSEAGRGAVAVLMPPTAPAPASEAAPPAPVQTPSFDVAEWYTSREEEPEKHGVLIEALDGSRALASHNADNTFNPASLIKLATSLVALRRLGANFRFETRVYTEGTVDSSGTLRGKIYVKGNDPTFGDVAGAMIGRELRARGINDATEGVAVSPDFSFNYSESPEDSAERLARVMTFDKAKAKAERENRNSRNRQDKKERENRNDNSRQEKRANKNAREERNDKNNARVKKGDRKEQPVAEKEDSNEATREGTKESSTGDAKQSALVSDPPAGEPMFVLRSYPLREILLYMNAHSSNFVAERIGALVGGPEGIARFLVDELKLPPEQVSIERASGREHNRMTPRGLVAVVRALNAEAKRQGMRLEEIMPVASDDVGTLRRRFAGTPLEGALVGKTGTLTSEVDGGMASLAGVIYTQNAGAIVFAILDQGSHISENRELEDQLLADIVTLGDTPINLPEISRDTPRRILPSTSLEISDR
jgi:D-alanyl-D-alanine carboxypeptidase/D-alanyl-D-alanine-endopeptidase (penicillin-binding protein 4)